MIEKIRRNPINRLLNNTLEGFIKYSNEGQKVIWESRPKHSDAETASKRALIGVSRFGSELIIAGWIGGIDIPVRTVLGTAAFLTGGRVKTEIH